MNHRFCDSVWILKGFKTPSSSVLCHTECIFFDLEFSLRVRQQRYVSITLEMQQESLRDKIAIESSFDF